MPHANMKQLIRWVHLKHENEMLRIMQERTWCETKYNFFEKKNSYVKDGCWLFPTHVPASTL